MSEPYVGEIRMFAGNFAPQNWMFCDGSLLSIAEFEVLFVLIGTTYGGNGTTTFALPDLRGRAPIHQGAGFVIGQFAGSENVTVTQAQMPQHTHVARGATVGNAQGPIGSYWSTDSGGNVAAYHTVQSAPGGAMNGTAIGAAGSGIPPPHMQQYLAVSYIISLFGVFPSQA